MRQIAIRAGHGNISPSTVHNLFRRSRVPNWAFLEHVIKALDGEKDREEFRALWRAAWDTENEPDAPRENPAEPVTGQVRAGDHLAGTPAGLTRGGLRNYADSLTPQRIWSNEIPPRNLDFTGRVAELETMRANLSSQRPRAQIICGTGGIGKTEIAAEYIHRARDEYEIIWWVRAEHRDRVRDALVKLGHRLELRQATIAGDRDGTIAAVIEALQSQTQVSWLLVYDNATSLLDLQKYLPTSRPGGHIIITSRELKWPTNIPTDSIEVSPFTPEDAVAFLRRRVPGLAAQDKSKIFSSTEDAQRNTRAGHLAAELGHLPIAIGHAAAYLAETAQSVDDYLAGFAAHAGQFGRGEPLNAELPAPVLGTWAMSTALLTPDAEHLFNLCAFFSPEPIAAELFLQCSAGPDDLPGSLEFLSSPQRFRAASSQLHRLSLAKVDGARDLIQVHRVVQAVTQEQLRRNHPDLFQAYRAAVDMLLAASNPGNPDEISADVAYDLSLQHLESDHRFLHSSNPALRGLIVDQVRRLHLRGALVEAIQFGQAALEVWRDRFGEDDLHVLTMEVEVAVAMYMAGRAGVAHELILRIRPLLQHHADGDGFKAFLLCESIRGADLRARSQFREALDLDLSILPKFQDVFGENHDRTLLVSNNIAVDYRQIGWFREALEADQRTLEARRKLQRPYDLGTLKSQTAVAHDLRNLGRYQESLDEAREVVRAFESAADRENLPWLIACDGFATALRKAGYHWEALQESEQVVQRYRDYLGIDHMYTLQATINLINAKRAVGDLAGAEQLARQTRDRCLESKPPDDLLYAALVNLASVLRAGGRAGEALFHDEQARRGLIRVYDDRHPFTLAADINYASDLAACGRLGEAIQLGSDTLARCRQSRGDEHPDTLMAAANLSIDEAAAGDEAGAAARLAEVLLKYEETLMLEHPEARAAAQGSRLTAEIDPYV